jgi:WD40 repeat protein
MMRLLVLVLGLGVCVPQGAFSQDSDLPPRDPILQIEAGMHTAAIRRIGADAACSTVVTGSEDKTVRLWRLSDGMLLKVMHPPIGPGNDGKIYAVAIAPNGKWVAAGGFSRTPGHHFVYLFDAETGSMVYTFGPFPQVVEHLAISPDGKFLAATLRAGQGVRVWQRTSDDLASWKLVVEDRDYGGKDSTGAAFDTTGALYTVGYDRKLRRYGPGFEKRAASVFTAGDEPSAVAVHPTDGLVALTYVEGRRVDVYETSSLQRVFWADASPAGSGAVSSVAWSGDGERLFAGGSNNIDRRVVVTMWGDRGKGAPRDVPVARDAILHLFPCGDGTLAAAGDPAFGWFRADGTSSIWKQAVGADMRGKLGGDFTVSADGYRVRFGLADGGRSPVLFDVPNGVLSDAPENPNDLYPPDVEGLPITNWNGSPAPRLGDNRLQLSPRERSQSVAVGPSKTAFVLGSDYYVRSYTADGNLVWQKQVPGVVWGVNVAKQGNVVVAACGDGTLRWYRLTDGALLLSAFIQQTDRRWIAWTPTGSFTTSVGGESLIGWVVNRTWSQAADYFPVAKFRHTFYQPGKVEQALVDSTSVLVSAVDTISVDPTQSVRSRQPPVVRIVSPGDGSVVASNEISIVYRIRSPSGRPVKSLSLYVDGALANADTRNDLWVMNSDFEFTGTIKANFPPRDATISLVAEIDDASSGADRAVLRWWKSEPDTRAIKPNLYALLIGAGDYEDKSLQLASPSNDVDDFEILLNLQKNKAFGDVKIVKLKDHGPQPATKQNILQKLVDLKNNVQAPEDIALVYFSGHGKSYPRGGGSYLLPVDFHDDPDLTAIPKSDLFNILKKINGGLMLFVDACYAANGLDTVDFLNETASWQTMRVITYASSDRNEVSLTSGRNSAFTMALVTGLGGNAPHQGSSLRTDELGVWLTTSVPRLVSPKKQTPEMIKSPSWQHIPIAEYQ